MTPSNNETVSPKRYYNYQEVFPFLEVLIENHDRLLAEFNAILDNDGWMDWPEKYLYSEADHQWTAFPFFAFGMRLDANCEACPETTRILSGMPNLRSAIYSRLAPKMRLQQHYGYAGLANYILRCHYGLIVPEDCGLWVDGETQIQKENEIIVFDDSMLHSGFNQSDRDRTVLFLDIDRPDNVPEGTSTVAISDEMIGVLEFFKSKTSAL